MTQKEMMDNLWPHPVEDTNGDKQVTLKEKALYILKMIPWMVMAILIPTLTWAAQDGIKTMMPIAVEFVRDIALSQIPGNEKAAIVRDRLVAEATAKGIVLATRDINRMIENALAVVDEETK